jgi:hypothetical protein
MSGRPKRGSEHWGGIPEKRTVDWHFDNRCDAIADAENFDPQEDAGRRNNNASAKSQQRLEQRAAQRETHKGWRIQWALGKKKVLADHVKAGRARVNKQKRTKSQRARRVVRLGANMRFEQTKGDAQRNGSGTVVAYCQHPPQKDDKQGRSFDNSWVLMKMRGRNPRVEAVPVDHLIFPDA